MKFDKKRFDDAAGPAALTSFTVLLFSGLFSLPQKSWPCEPVYGPSNMMVLYVGAAPLAIIGLLWLVSLFLED
jgi:hypothetical protein